MTGRVMVSGAWVPIDRVLNHPGHADQKSHGRKGGVRDSLANARTIEDVNAVTARELTRFLGHDVAVDFKGLDTAIAREHAEGLLQGAERFPNSRLGRVDTYGKDGVRQSHPGDPDGGAFAVTSSGPYSGNGDLISFNSDRGADAATYRRDVERNAAAGWQVAGNPMGTALHEYGHVVSGHDSAVYRVEQAAKAAAKDSHRRTSGFVTDNVSMYAAADGRELAAEAFADVMVNGTGAAALSKTLFKEIESDYQANGARR